MHPTVSRLHRVLLRALESIRGEFHERTWQAFWGVVIDGRTASDVAADLAMKPGTVRVSKSRVLLRLRRELGDAIPPGLRPPYLTAQADRFRALLAGPQESAESGFQAAEAGFREIGVAFWLAVTLLQHGEWLVARGRPDGAAPLLAEARETFERLETTPWLDRLELAEAALDETGARA